MTIRQLPGIGLVTFLAAAMPAAAIAQSAQQQTPPPAQEKPVDPKAPASVAGKWDMSAEGPQGTETSTMVLKLDGKKVSGGLTGQRGELPLEGEFADGKLTFAISLPTDGATLSITFAGTLKEDGTLAGTFDFGQGAMNWKATRAKN